MEASDIPLLKTIVKAKKKNIRSDNFDISFYLYNHPTFSFYET